MDGELHQSGGRIGPARRRYGRIQGCSDIGGDAVGHNNKPSHIAFSHDRDRRIAQLMIPTRE
jgi:hypothetical protein